MDRSRESKTNDRFETPLLKYYQQQVMELKVSKLIVGDKKGIFTNLKIVNCDNFCYSTYMVFLGIHVHYKITTVTKHKIIKVFHYIFWKTLPFMQNLSLPKSFCDIFGCQYY